MRKKTAWLMLGCLIVVAMVLASCGPAEVEEEEEGKTVVGEVIEGEEEEEGEEEVEAGPEMVRDAFGKLKEKPLYGGTITFAFANPTGTQILDPLYSTRGGLNAIQTYGRLGTADWSKGPQGTNEFPFNSSYIPDEYLMGDVVESWEIIDLMTIIFKLRENVYWHNVPPMNGRQFTVEDVEFSFDLGSQDPRNVYYTEEERDPELPPFFVKIDKYTFQLMYDEEDTRMLHGVMNWLYMVPREVWEEYGDLNDPKHQVGIGPFILEDVVSDSSLTWRRNPNYHHFDQFFPENRLPYIDGINAIVIPDESTRLAALRTYKTDWMFVPWDKVAGMEKSNPELKYRQVLPDASNTMWPRNDLEPYSDKKVRQAVALAIDQPSILEEYYGGLAYMLTWPVMPSFVDHYTPLEELPELSRKLYEHQPELAKELLAEAGYPAGFTTDVQVSSANPRGIEVMSLVKGYLAEVGIDMEITVMEPTTFGNVLWVRQFPGFSYISWGNQGIDDAFGWAHGGWVSDAGVGSVYAFSNVVDPVAQETYETLVTTTDPAERSRIRLEENLREIDLCWEIPIPTPASFWFWSPWVKGYAGEVGPGPDPVENSGIFRYVWIDQDLKSAITGK